MSKCERVLAIVLHPPQENGGAKTIYRSISFIAVTEGGEREQRMGIRATSPHFGGDPDWFHDLFRERGFVVSGPGPVRASDRECLS